MNRISAMPLLAAAALAAVGAPPALAAAPARTPEAAMRKGVRDFAKSVDAHASKVRVDCGAAGAVGHRAPCRGTFWLRVDGGGASTYRLTSRARVLRISPRAFEYRVAADVVGVRAAGLPARVGGFSGFLQ